MGRYGVTCNAIRPLARTRLGLQPQQLEAAKKAAELGDPRMLQVWEEIERLMPEDVSPLLVYLTTDEAANINGCVFWVAGGEIGIYPEPTPIKTIFKKEGHWTVDDLVEIMPIGVENDTHN